jgi:hypothetical protein
VWHLWGTGRRITHFAPIHAPVGHKLQSQQTRPSPICAIERMARSGKGDTIRYPGKAIISWWLVRAVEHVMEGRCYVMKDWFGISSAYLSSGVSTRGQRRLHHAADGGFFAREEGDDAPQNSCRTIRS